MELYDEKCYEVKTLKISKDPFQCPENLSIKVDCYELKKAEATDSLASPPKEEENPH